MPGVLLSVDWDFFSGSVEHTFDAPLWGSPDREADRLERWRERARRRDPNARGWEALDADFPLLDDPSAPLAYVGAPAWVAWSHAHAHAWLARFPGRRVVNVDSHHDLFSLSGDPSRWRPGNWAGLALAAGLTRDYACVYPAWHAGVRVAEGFDLDRTWGEVRGGLAPDLWPRVSLARGAGWPDPADVEAVLLVQSPAWTNPAHDAAFLDLARALRAEELSPPLARPFA